MEKKIKIIDLLNKIANGEEVPKKIKIDEETLILENGKELHYRFEGNTATLCFEWYIETRKLNDFVEILDEEDEFEDIELSNLDTDELVNGKDIRPIDYLLEGKINALIKNQKKIISKLGDNND